MNENIKLCQTLDSLFLLVKNLPPSYMGMESDGRRQDRRQSRAVLPLPYSIV